MSYEIATEKNLDKVLQDLDALKKIQAQGWVIRYHGKAITLKSGKALWKRENHAKAALANHFSEFYDYALVRQWGFKNGTELAKYLTNLGVLKVEPL